MLIYVNRFEGEICITILFDDELQLATLIVQELIVEWINSLRAPQHLFKVMLERSYKIHIMNNGTLELHTSCNKVSQASISKFCWSKSCKHENNGQKVLFKGKTVWWITWIWEKMCILSNSWDRQIGNLRFFEGTNWLHVSLAQQMKGFVLEEIFRWHSKVWWIFRWKLPDFTPK